MPEPSWNADSASWVDYADEVGVEVDPKWSRERIRRVVLAVPLVGETDGETDDETDDDPENDADDDSDDTDDGPADVPPEPPRGGEGSGHDAWVAYAVAKGADPDYAEDQTRDELIEEFAAPAAD